MFFQVEKLKCTNASEAGKNFKITRKSLLLDILKWDMILIAVIDHKR